MKKYKVTASMEVGYQTTLEAKSEEEANKLAWDLDFHLWEKKIDGMYFELEDIEEITSQYMKNLSTYTLNY